MRSTRRYLHLPTHNRTHDRVHHADSTSHNRHAHYDSPHSAPWYWRFVAMAASWMILAGFLVMPGLYAVNPDLRISQAVLSVFVVVLLTAGYSSTALLCIAVRDNHFHAHAVFFPVLVSSALGLLTVAYNFSASRAYAWGTAAVSAAVISASATLLYGSLFFWTRRKTHTHSHHNTHHRSSPQPHDDSLRSESRSNLWSDAGYYQNYIANMYPAALSPSAPTHSDTVPLTEDDQINQNMALLLMKSDSRYSPDTSSATFRIDLPDDEDEHALHHHDDHSASASSSSQQPSRLVSTPPAGSRHASRSRDRDRDRSTSRPDSLGEQHAWTHWADRGRPLDRPTSMDSGHSRNKSREERRREIELGLGCLT